MTKLVRLSALVLAIAAGCVPPGPSPVAPTTTTFPTLLSTVGTPDGVLGVAREEGSVALYMVDAEGAHLLSSANDGANAPTVHLIAYGGETGQVYNSYVFGIAPANAARVQVAPGPVLAGAIVDDTYVVALAPKDVSPSDLQWNFSSADGAVVAEGTGITP